MSIVDLLMSPDPEHDPVGDRIARSAMDYFGHQIVRDNDKIVWVDGTYPERDCVIAIRRDDGWCVADDTPLYSRPHESGRAALQRIIDEAEEAEEQDR